MRSIITVSRSSRQGATYTISIVMANGKSVRDISAPGDDGNVAALAAKYAVEHCLHNTAGGDIVGPKCILDLIPAHLRNVPGTQKTQTLNEKFENDWRMK